MFRRNIEERVREAASHSRVVLINGPRQAGKTTLVRELMDFGREATYITFDDVAQLSSNDTGLLAGILSLDERRLNREPVYLGQLLESFAVMELRKQMGWNETPVKIFHFRNRKGAEVDIVLESASGEIAGVEVKSTATPRAEDFAGLRYLQSAVGARFRKGVLLHAGDQATGASKDLYALPFSALWRRYPS